MSLFNLTNPKVKAGRTTGGHKAVRRVGAPVLAALSIAGPIGWLTRPDVQPKSGYVSPVGPGPLR